MLRRLGCDCRSHSHCSCCQFQRTAWWWPERLQVCSAHSWGLRILQGLPLVGAFCCVFKSLQSTVVGWSGKTPAAVHGSVALSTARSAAIHVVPACGSKHAGVCGCLVASETYLSGLLCVGSVQYVCSLSGPCMQAVDTCLICQQCGRRFSRLLKPACTVCCWLITRSGLHVHLIVNLYTSLMQGRYAGSFHARGAVQALRHSRSSARPQQRDTLHGETMILS
jgi:hypothetical protein